MTKTIPLIDLTFFLLESKSSPTHVASPMLFQLPEDAGKRYVATLRRAAPDPPPRVPASYPEIPIAVDRLASSLLSAMAP